MAMAEIGALLKELHRLRSHIHDLQSKLDFAPKALQAQKNKMAAQDAALKAAQDEIKKLKLTINEKELAVKTTAAQVAKYEKQLDGAANKKEYDTLTQEIADGKARMNALDDETLTLMGTLEEKVAALPAIEERTKKVQAEVAQFEKGQTEQLEGWKTEKARAEGELAEVEKTIPAEMSPIYKRAVASKGHEALAAVDGRVCQSCNTEVTAQMGTELTRGNLVVCKSCGRLLYRA
jgi:predicted  nucleic acid-binding Zn-ribbon protein